MAKVGKSGILISDLHKEVQEKINYGEELLQSTEQFGQLEGLQKLQRKIKQELEFLRKIAKNGTIKKEHLQCSNLTHFSAVLNTLKKVHKCISVNKVFMLDDRKITIDIICDDGLSWVKVIARNPKSLSQICLGDASYGVKSIVDQADEYLECAELYPCLFQPPKITFVFANGVDSNLANNLESMGITVQGKKIDEFENISKSEDDNSSHLCPRVPCISRVNLDVSAMLAYVSSVTNGSAELYEFSVKVLAQQAEWERERPQKPILDNFFKGKKLYCCETARNNFVNIVQTVGGPNEKIRANELLESLTVLPDSATIASVEEENESRSFQSTQLSSNASLSVGGKIRERALIIFTFGDRIGAVTVTANEGFVRAAQQQGVNFAVFLHESRALTEQKEKLKGMELRP